MADDLETWYAALGIWPYHVCSNDDHWLTWTFLPQGQIRSLRLLCGKMPNNGF